MGVSRVLLSFLSVLYIFGLTKGLSEGESVVPRLSSTRN